MSETDPFQTADWRKFSKQVATDLVPKLADSAATMALFSGAKADVKQAVELGFSLLMDKPIILVVLDGAVLPAKLRAIADLVIEVPVGMPLTDPAISEQITKGTVQILGEERA